MLQHFFSMYKSFQLALLVLIPVFLSKAQDRDSLSIKLESASNQEEELSIYVEHIGQLVFLDINKAIELSNKAYDIAIELNDSIYIGKLHNIVGIGYYLKGNYLVAIDYYIKALEYFELLNDTTKIANVYNNLGITYNQINNNGKALEYHLKSKSLNEITHNDENLTAAINNIGNVYESMGELDSAEFYFRETLKMAEKTNQEDLIATAYLNIGTLYIRSGEFATALEYLNKALELDEDAKNYMGLVETYSALGETYIGLRDFRNAKYFLDKALNYSIKYDLNIEESRVYKLISSYYEKIGNTSVALDFYKKHTELRDSIYSLDVTKQIEDLQLSYEKRKQDQEIALLKERNSLKDTQLDLQKTKTRLLMVLTILTIFILGLLGINIKVKGRANKLLKQQNEKIQQQNEELEKHSRMLEEMSEEKDNFINVVAHDLKSPLNNIIGLANLIKINGKLNDEQLEYITLLDQVAGEAKNLISNLLDISKLESGLMEQEIMEFDVQQLIIKVISSFEDIAAEKKIQIRNTCLNTININSNKAFIERILDNLVSNAIKFSPEKKEVEIACDLNNTILILSVKDEGPGFTDQDKADLYKKFQKLSARPTSGESSTGLGLAIVKLLVEKLNGEIELLSNPDRGSEFRIKIPVTQV